MKKSLLVLALAFVCVLANAQFYVGGSLAFWNDGDAKRTSFNIIPEVGYNINDRWTVGGEIGFAYDKSGDLKTNAFVFSPYARYTYLTAGPVSLFVDGGFGIYKRKDVDMGFNVGLQPGFAISLTEKSSLVSKFGFLGYNDAFGGNADGFGLSLANNVSFGFYVNL